MIGTTPTLNNSFSLEAVTRLRAEAFAYVRHHNAMVLTIATAIETASAQGWRRPLLAWLNVELQRAEAVGATSDAERLRRRIALVGAP